MAGPVRGRHTDDRSHFFFGTENLWAQSLMTGMLSVIIFSGLLTAIAIDQPFVGVIKVEPEALAEVLADFGSQ